MEAIKLAAGVPAGMLYAMQNGHAVHELNKLESDVPVRLWARMRGGMPHANHRVPPGWDPTYSEIYPFDDWKKDVERWAMATNLRQE
eukprot:5359892-Heterocapsa_arctica.AAC.1